MKVYSLTIKSKVYRLPSLYRENPAESFSPMPTQHSDFLILDNGWSCFDGRPIDAWKNYFHHLNWILSVKESFKDANVTWCSKPNSKKWTQDLTSDSKFLDVTLLYFLEFHEVRHETLNLSGVLLDIFVDCSGDGSQMPRTLRLQRHEL
jgi:hypothetical protein